MKNTDDIKEKIIGITTDLIQEGKGNVDDITTRMIAEKANIGIGLINYHFQSKNNLMKICVHRIVNDVVTTCNVDHISDDMATQLKHTAKLVMDYIMENSSIARMSILEDFESPQNDDNVMGTISGFFGTIGGSGTPRGKELIMLFSLISTLASMFLRKDICKEVFGIDMYDKCQRNSLVETLVDTLF